MSRWRGALVGFGSIAEHAHLPRWVERSDVEVVAVVDPAADRLARARALLPQVEGFPDLQSLLAARKGAIDFADVSCPPGLHVFACRALLEAGLHVLCEKPLATRAGEAAELIQKARGAGRALLTVHNWKASPQYRRVRELIDAGAVGRLQRVRIEVERTGQSATAGPQWRRRAGLAGGGILVDHGWHAFYLVLGLLPSAPRAIAAAVERKADPKAEVEDTAECRIEANGAVAEIVLTWAGSRRRNRWIVEGDAGRIDVDDDRLVVEGRSGSEERFAEALSAGSFHPEWFREVAEEFVQAMKAPARAEPNQQEAYTCALLLERAYASAQSGGCLMTLPDPLGVPEPAL